MILISKSFEFDFGHRVWTQTLDPSFSITDQCVCKRLHGHRGKVEIYLKANNLVSETKLIQQTGLLTDFKHLNFVKALIDEVIDHKTLIHVEDPFLHKFIEFDPTYIYTSMILNTKKTLISYNVLDTIERIRSYMDNKDGMILVSIVPESKVDNETKNWLESFVITNFVPTAENIAKFFYEYVSTKFKGTNIVCDKVIFYETPKSKAIYIGE